MPGWVDLEPTKENKETGHEKLDRGSHKWQMYFLINLNYVPTTKHRLGFSVQS